MPIIVRRPLAKRDLAEIWSYIADDNENNADDFIEKIGQKFETLASRPLIGRSRNELAEGLRSFSVGRYIIFYRPFQDGVEIIRVLHSSLDIDSLFSPET